MMRMFFIGFACLALASCETGTYCTEEFRSVGFTWTTPPLPARVITVNAPLATP